MKILFYFTTSSKIYFYSMQLIISMFKKNSLIFLIIKLILIKGQSFEGRICNIFLWSIIRYLNLLFLKFISDCEIPNFNVTRDENSTLSFENTSIHIGFDTSKLAIYEYENTSTVNLLLDKGEIFLYGIFA